MMKQSVCLIGPVNSGKTTSLRYLIEELKDKKEVQSISLEFLSGRPIPNKIKVEARYAFLYHGVRFAICTAGDSMKLVDENVAFAKRNKSDVLIMAVRDSVSRNKRFAELCKQEMGEIKVFNKEKSENSDEMVKSIENRDTMKSIKDWMLAFCKTVR